MTTIRILVLTTAMLTGLLAFAGDAQAADEFAIGKGDILEVSVWKDDVLTRELLVRPDGNISFPLIGEVRAAGRTVDELRAEVQERIKEYVPNAPVTVILTELNSMRVYIVGEVEKPGMYTLPEPVSVAQALALAGGPTPYASTDTMTVIRDGVAGQKIIKVEFGDIVKRGDVAQNIDLLPGDTLVVN
jgi:polysaccharide export outer membrane protein